MSNQVLLVNGNSVPLRVVTTKKAMSLINREKVVPDYCAEFVDVGTSKSSYKLPTIIRLKYVVNVPSRKTKWSKWGVLRRDNYTCGYCGYHSLQHRSKFTVDHIIPRIQNGKNTWGNTICACRKCNLRKGGRTPTQAGMKLLFEPKTPRTDYLIVSGEIPKEWKVYLEV